MPISKFIRLGALAAIVAPASGGRRSVVVAQTAPPPLVPFHGLIDYVSVNMNGWPPTTSVDAGPHAISADGRHVAFASNASNLVDGDTNGHWDIFGRDLDINAAFRASATKISLAVN